MAAQWTRNKQADGALMQHVGCRCERASPVKHACQNASRCRERVRVFPPGRRFGNLRPFMSWTAVLNLIRPRLVGGRSWNFWNSSPDWLWRPMDVRHSGVLPVLYVLLVFRLLVGALLEVNSDLWQTHRRQRCSDKQIRIQIRPEVNEDDRKWWTTLLNRLPPSPPCLCWPEGSMQNMRESVFDT